ncbi:MAG: PAS domain-containing protein [Gemmatimonadetes bacterium]|nr:PAS domain-containing protein [Gemmatimonadota bacterium]
MTTTETSHPAGASAGGNAQSAEHYRRQLDTLAQNATLALFIMDEHQRCTYMNPAAEQLTGFTLAEVQGKALHDYVHHTRPDGTPYPLEECPIDRAFPQNMREQGEETFVHRDGHFYPVAFTASPIRDGERTVGTIIEARDITADRQAEAERRRLLNELELERARLRTVFRESPAFIAMVTGPNHVFELANPPYYQLVGHRDIVGKPVAEAIPEVVEQGFLALLDNVYATGQPFIGTEVPVQLQREAGAGMEARFVNFVYQPLPGPDGTVSGILAHGVDVTELVEQRRRLEEQAAELEAQTEELTVQAQQMEEVQVELEISNEQLQRAMEGAGRESAQLDAERSRLRELFMQAPALIAVLRGPEHVFELANPPYLATIGGREVLGRTIRQALPEVEGQGYFEMLDGVYASGEPVVGNESLALIDRQGNGTLEEGFFNFVFQPLRDGDAVSGILIHAVEVTTQVRARREVEAKADELGRLARQLEASNKELDQFAYVASHDLKAPLRGIANLSSWIEEDLGERVTDEAREHLELLRGRVDRMEGLIDGILQYSRAGRVREEPEEVDVQALVEEAEDLLALPAGFEVRVPEPLPRMVTERLPLQQVFMNLIGNAAKYNTSPGPWVQVTAGDLGSAFEFSVADNGPGIAPEYHERIFGIFQTLQARDKVEGTGIGLSLVKKLVESRGGRIWVESPPNGGATFRFTWPRGGDDGSGR